MLPVVLAALELGLRAATGNANFSPPVFEPRDGLLQIGLLPNLSTQVRQFGRTVTIETGPDGHRRTVGTPNNSATIVHLIGDSQAFGWGLSDHETIASRLQAKLGPTAVVVNHGVPGYGPIQYHAILNSVPEGDLVIVLHTEENDLADTFGLTTGAGVSCRLLISVAGLFDRIGCAALQLRTAQYLLGQISAFQHRKNFTPLEFSAHSRVAASVLAYRVTRSYAAERSRRGERLLLTIIPWKGRYAPQWRATYAPAPYSGVATQPTAFPDDLGMVAQFAASPDSPGLYLAGDSHLSPAGAERVAQVLGDRLISHLALTNSPSLRTPQ